MAIDSSGDSERPVFDDPNRIAYEAGHFLEYLSIPANAEAELLLPDGTGGLDRLHSLENSIEGVQTFHRNEAEWMRIARFKELCHDFHTALPYSEAERTWLDPKVGAVLGEEDAVEQISQNEGQIVSAGIRQTVRGRDLMRRWISWRRETDEYAGQNTVGVARSALAGLIGLLEPRRPLPEAYVTLMRERDAAPPEA